MTSHSVGEGEREGCEEGEVQGDTSSPNNLLKKLEEQNRLLEKDRKSHVILGRSSSFRSVSDSDSVNSLRTSIINEEHLAIEEVMSQRSHNQHGEEGKERKETHPLVRLRTGSEVSVEQGSPDLRKLSSGGEREGEGGGDRLAEAGGEEAGKEEGEDLWVVWSDILKNWEENFKRNQKQIRQLVRQGIPGPLRGMAWQLMCGPQDINLRDRYPSLLTEVSPFERQIQRDLARTFPEHSFFKERDGLGQEALLNILKAYSVFDREVGYCQGSPFITGLLLMQKMPEEDAFCVFVRLMYDYKLRDLFKPSMADLGLCFFQLDRLVEELYPLLYLHFQAVEFHTSMYASPWFLTMFASVLSLNVVFRIMDIFLIEGRDIVFKIGLALLEHSQDKLIQLDMEDMVKHFQKEMKTTHEANPDELIRKAQRIKLNPRKMKKLEKDYQLRKERHALENVELMRLQQTNVNLQKTVRSLEQECSSLADKLIQGQVSRAQEAEEMFIIKKELAKTRRKLLELEERQSRKESTESNESLCEDSPKVVSGEGGSGRGDDGGEDGEGEEVDGELMFDCGPELTVIEDEQTAEQLHVISPDHVTREEAEQVLRKLGVASPDQPIPLDDSLVHNELPTSPLPPSVSDKVDNPHIIVDNSNCNNIDSSSSEGKSNQIGNGHVIGTSPALAVAPNTKMRKRRVSSSSADPALIANLRKSQEEMTQELAKAKLQYAEAMVLLEQKKMEARQALLRESQAVREMDAARSYITALEQRLSECQMEKLSCPHCSQKLEQQETDPADPNSSDVLFSHLRAMWNSQAATHGSGSPSRNPHFGHNLYIQ